MTFSDSSELVDDAQCTPIGTANLFRHFRFRRDVAKNVMTILNFRSFFSFLSCFIANLSAFVVYLCHFQTYIDSNFRSFFRPPKFPKKTNSIDSLMHFLFVENLSAFIDDAHPSARQSRFGVACPQRFGWQRSMDFA